MGCMILATFGDHAWGKNSLVHVTMLDWKDSMKLGLQLGFAVGLGLAGATLAVAPGWAQSGEGAIAQTPQRQSELLLTQPASVNRTAPTGDRLPSDTLNTVADSIQANPSRPQEGGIPDNLVPKDLIHVPSKLFSDSHPLEQFQNMEPNRSVGINLNRL